MPDFINKLVEKLHLPAFLKSALDHNRFTALAVVIVTSLGGCALIQPRVVSPVSGQRVSRTELAADAAAFAAQAQADQDALAARVKVMGVKFDAKFDELASKERVVDEVLGMIAKAAAVVPTPAAPFVLPALSLLTLGLGLDNNRKGRVIAAIADNSTGPPATP